MKMPYGMAQLIAVTTDYEIQYTVLKRGGIIPKQYNSLIDLFFYVVAGYGKYTDNAGTTYEVRPGDRFVVLSGEQYSLEGSPNYDLTLIQTSGVNPDNAVVLV
jgi:quercetin dioxygenase-like cupin family protein